MSQEQPGRIAFVADVGCHRIEARFVEEHQVATCEGVVAATPADLVRCVPDLTEPAHLPAYCRLASFLLTGNRFRPIQDPAAFRAQAEPGPGAPDYGPFDLGEITDPEVRAGALRFYVTDAHSEVPYRVTSPFPPKGPADEVRYEILPYRQGPSHA